MDVFAFVDPTQEQEDTAIEVAAAMAEFCMSERRQLALVCDTATALEIGLAVMGQHSARTVEGDERMPSPLRILRLIGREDLIAEPTGDEPDQAVDMDSVQELQSLGVIDEIPTVEFDISRLQPLVRDAARQAHIVIGLGGNPAFWMAAYEGTRDRTASFISIRGLGPPPELEIRVRELPIIEAAVVRETEEALDDETRRAMTRAQRAGQVAGTLLSFLIGD